MPSGGMVRASLPAPQQATVSSDLKAQIKFTPPTMDLKVPSGGELTPPGLPLLPQQDKVPSVFRPQVHI